MSSTSLQTGARIVGGLIVLAGVINLILAPIIGSSVFENLWGVEPFSYIGAILVMAGLGAVSLSYIIPRIVGKQNPLNDRLSDTTQQWSQLTKQYFELFDHDLGRPLRRVLGKERELRAVIESSTVETNPFIKDLLIKDLLDEIEGQVPNFRLMMANIQVLVQLEAPDASVQLQPVEPSEVVRNIIDRYTSVASETHKEITWWADPAEFGIVYSDSSAIEHIVTNVVDNAVRFATAHVEVKLTKNPTHFFIRVWDDGDGIPAHYIPHIFDHGWTPAVSRREEKSSSGLGLFIARTLANRHGGDLTVESVPAPDPDQHTAFLISLPLGKP